MQYPYLFSEGRIGKLAIRNRVVMAPMGVGMANFDGTPSEQITAYFRLTVDEFCQYMEPPGKGIELEEGVESDDRLARELEPRFARVRVVGDARQPGRIHNAVRDGFDAAWEL